MKHSKKSLKLKLSTANKSLPAYKPPQVISYTQEDILEVVGPAYADYGPPPGDNP